MQYSFKWKRLGHRFSTTEKNVIGSGYAKEADKFVVRYSGGGVKEIPEWSKCQFEAGPDYHAAEKEALENQTGQSIPTKKL